MDWWKQSSTYYLDGALLRAGEAAEVLWVRAKSYAAKEETDGLVPREVLPLLTPTRGPSRAAALVREGLWRVVPKIGWEFVPWDQKTKLELEIERDAARERQARARSRKPSRRDIGVSHAGSHARVTGTEVEVEVDAAAAAARGGSGEVDPAGGGVAELPVLLEIFRARLQGVTALAGLRFDQLTATQLADLERLVETHGDERLVDVAVRTLRHPAPTSVAAFLGTWRSLPPPGQHLGLVRRRCDVHDVELTPAGVCRSCAADRLETGDR